MKIKSLSIQNFKGIKEKAVLPLAPITLFFGPIAQAKVLCCIRFYIFMKLLQKVITTLWSVVLQVNSYILVDSLLNALNACFSIVESEFKAARWVSFEGNIYLDKNANGCWVIREKDLDGLHKPFPNGGKIVKQSIVVL